MLPNTSRQSNSYPVPHIAALPLVPPQFNQGMHLRVNRIGINMYESPANYNYSIQVICEILINADIYNLAHRCSRWSFGSHTTEACPLNNSVNRKLVIEMSEKLPQLAQENHVELKEQFHSACA